MVEPILGKCLWHCCYGVLLVLATRCRSCSLPLLVHVDLLCFVTYLDKSADEIGGEAWLPLEVASFDFFVPCIYGWVA